MIKSLLQDSPYPRETQTPVLNILKKTKNENTGSLRSIPKHSKKVSCVNNQFFLNTKVKLWTSSFCGLVFIKLESVKFDINPVDSQLSLHVPCHIR